MQNDRLNVSVVVTPVVVVVVVEYRKESTV